MDGARPYQDYWWPYGPLTPYYYSVFFRIFGVSITSVMIAKIFFVLIAGAFFFLALSCFTPALTALTGTIWFYIFNPDFTHTYNHIAATSLFMPVMYSLFLYIKNQKSNSLYGGLLCIFFITLIKFNIGVSTLLAFITSIFLIDRTLKVRFSKHKKYIYISAFFILPLMTLLVYLFFTQGLPFYYLRQCLPFLTLEDPHAGISPLHAFQKYFLTIWDMAFSRPIRTYFSLIVLFASLHFLYQFLKKQCDKKIFLSILVLLLFAILQLHEFFASGVFYRTYWANSFYFIIMFLLISFFINSLLRRRQILILLSLLFISFYIFIGGYNWKNYFIKNTRDQFFIFHSEKFYAQNRSVWFRTIKQTTSFLKEALQDEETFLAIPYAPLYFFLTDKRSSVRYLQIFEYMDFPEVQQEEIIAELESKSINYILISNRANSSEQGLGTFGKTYCKLLAYYIDQHFELIAQFGDWSKSPTYMENHATRILKRKHLGAGLGT